MGIGNITMVNRKLNQRAGIIHQTTPNIYFVEAITYLTYPLVEFLDSELSQRMIRNGKHPVIADILANLEHDSIMRTYLAGPALTLSLPPREGSRSRSLSSDHLQPAEGMPETCPAQPRCLPMPGM